MLRPQTKFVGVMGWPLTHTLSPVIHNAAFRRAGLDWIYLAWPVAPGDVERAVEGIRALGAIGANVTMPHKESVLPYLDELSQDARAVGAVNTIQRFGEKLLGHNTDVTGFSEFVAGDAGLEVKGRSALVLGSGGAARAVVKALADLHAAQVVIVARNADKAAGLPDLVSAGLARVEPWSDAERLCEEADIIVNATPVGGDGDDPVPDARWRRDQFVVDLLYDPPSTPLLERARANGAAAWGGLGMLVRQAAASFALWTGQEAPLETMSAAAVRAIGQARPGA